MSAFRVHTFVIIPMSGGRLDDCSHAVRWPAFLLVCEYSTDTKFLMPAVCAASFSSCCHVAKGAAAAAAAAAAARFCMFLHSLAIPIRARAASAVPLRASSIVEMRACSECVVWLVAEQDQAQPTSALPLLL